jgi:site-specific DNA-methyltransferase (adenine-specific)
MMDKIINTIQLGDCIELMNSRPQGCIDLVFADPPFNIGYDYETYEDNLEYEQYIKWTSEWMGACYNILADNGSFYIAIGDEYAAEVNVTARKLGLETRNWIIWTYGFGQNTTRKFGRSHTHIFYFVKDPKNFTFNAKDIRIPSARQIKYNDKRGDPDGRIPGDVWKYPRVCGTFKERVQWHPCQMPLKLLARIIKASSNPGDLVMDPFSGSATTLVAAAVLGRNYLGFEIDPKYVELGQKRINEMLDSGISDIDEKEENGIIENQKIEKMKTATLFETNDD